ncbi:hypothetical protein TRAPUB_11451 [Trametes pubescens]|uniref:Uncharacterized protein n=1 Tax=Trametes pubescens TaxID=154538 RepID=A0A1M2VWM0_TRAPU|nr:hypothetical protein TRAPUB_11451 [Trametes pubescens]
MLMREEEEEPEHDVPVTVVTHQPQDLPPRARSSHGGHPSSKPCTPKPVRPSRPGAVAPTRCSPPLMNICDSGPATPHNPVQSSSPSRTTLLPSDIPPRARTPPGGNPPGSQHGSPQPLRPTRPSADGADVDICASTVSIDVPTHVLPLPPRVRTPPGPPTTVSQPCTPQPGRPVRPSGDEAARDTDKRSFDDQLAEACLAMVTTLSILKVKRGLIECEAALKAGDGLFASADEDNKPVVGVPEAPEQTKGFGNKSGPAKGRAKMAPSPVKLEDSSIASGQAQVATTVQKVKRAVKPKTGKKAKAVDGVSVKLEQIATSATKKPRKKGPTKGAAVSGENVNNPTAATRAGKKKKAGGRRAGAAATGQGDASAPAQVHVSLSRTSSLQRRESYKDIRHPPRTCSYVPDHLQALGTVLWDAEGFECMELSALPWLAGTAQHAHGGNEVRIREWDEAETPLVQGRVQADKRYQMIFVPDVPEHIFMDEEDVRLRLHEVVPWCRYINRF